MGNLVFQATLGGQVNLVGPNTASTYNINVPTVNGNLVTTGDTGTVTNTMCATSVYTAPGTIGSGTPNTGAFTTLAASSTVTLSGGTANGVAYLNGSKVVTSGSALVFDGTNLGVGVAPSAWSSYKALQFGAQGAVASASTATYFGNNWYSDGTDKYIATGTAGLAGWEGNVFKFYQAASGTAGAAATFTTAMTLNASGNLGLGVTPNASWTGSANLQIGLGAAYSNGSIGAFDVSYNSIRNGSNTYVYAQSSLQATRFQQRDGAFNFFTAASGTAGNAITFTQAMTLDASGNLALGVTSTTFKLHVAGTGYFTGDLRLKNSGSNTSFVRAEENSTSAAYTYATMDGRSTGYWAFSTNDTERARIDSSGNLLVGSATTSDNSGIGIKSLYSATAPYVATVGSASTNGTVAYSLYSTGGAAFRFYVGYGGTVYATSTTITGISDRRLKENIRDLDDGLSSIMALQPRKFDWKEGKGADTKNARGFIAQEFETVFPDLIDEWKDPAPEGEDPYKAVRADLIPVLVKAIQEQQAIIAQQSLAIESLTARLDAANL